MLDFVSIKNFRSIVELALPLNYGEAKAPNGYKEWTTVPFLEIKGWCAALDAKLKLQQSYSFT